MTDSLVVVDRFLAVVAVVEGYNHRTAIVNSFTYSPVATVHHTIHYSTTPDILPTITHLILEHPHNSTANYFHNSTANYFHNSTANYLIIATSFTETLQIKPCPYCLGLKIPE